MMVNGIKDKLTSPFECACAGLPDFEKFFTASLNGTCVPFRNRAIYYPDFWSFFPDLSFESTAKRGNPTDYNEASMPVAVTSKTMLNLHT